MQGHESQGSHRLRGCWRAVGGAGEVCGWYFVQDGAHVCCRSVLAPRLDVHVRFGLPRFCSRRALPTAAHAQADKIIHL